jgi:hypothetical protein
MSSNNLNNQNNFQSYKKPEKSRRGLVLITLIFILLVIAGVFLSIKFYSSKNKDSNSNQPNQQNTTYLTNKNNIICSFDEHLNCEDLQTKSIKSFSVPKQYQGATISSSPDGSKLLIESSEGVDVTDSNFKNSKTIFSQPKSDKKKRTVLITWANDSNNLLLSEIVREENDADFLPKPLVVKLHNISTGESKTIYKTGENTDAESIQVIGSNDKYMFISYNPPKNWVADNTDPPPVVINAVSLFDGQVLPVNSQQVNAKWSDQIYYDSNKNIFVALSSDDATSSNIIVSELEDGELGLVLKKRFSLVYNGSVNHNLTKPIMSSKGILGLPSTRDSEKPVFEFINDAQTVTKLDITTKDKYFVFMSLNAMPQID